MARHPYIETIARYFNGANAGDPAQMLPCFADDIAAYTMGFPPRFGSRAVAQTFVELHSMHARWTIDHCVVQEPEVVVEWTMLANPSDGSAEVMHRGIDWFVFRADGRIQQIREFLHTTRSLDAFPYAERGYPAHTNFDSRLPN